VQVGNCSIEYISAESNADREVFAAFLRTSAWKKFHIVVRNHRYGCGMENLTTDAGQGSRSGRMDVSGYVLEHLREDKEFMLHRGHGKHAEVPLCFY
jgi:hypothetical protein